MVTSLGPGTPNALQTASRSRRSVVSSTLIDTWSASTRQTLTPRWAASLSTSSARPGTDTVTVSKKFLVTTSMPAVVSPSTRVPAWPWTRRAIAASPAGPWYTAYIEAITARSTWAVQMLDVA